MSTAGRRRLWALIVAGTAARAAVAFSTYGVGFDVDSYVLVREALADDPLHLYGDVGRWPYPPGFFLWILAVQPLEGATGLLFTDLVQVPAILADAAIAFLVQDYLGRHGAGERRRLAAAGLVALGPAFLVVSGYHGQIDSLAILPALLALAVWERPGARRRALAAGVLIGLGGVVKTVPLIVLLALLPRSRSLREGTILVGAALAIPFLATIPFAIADPDAVGDALRYRGVPGVGGISLLVQPNLARTWMNEVPVEGSDLTFLLLDWGGAVTAAVVLGVAAFLFRRRPGAAEGAALLYLAVWAFGINFFLQYVIWGFPFLLMAGYVREVALAQLAMIPAIVLVYLRPWEAPAAAYAYVPASLALWGASVAGFVLLARRIGRAGPPHPPVPRPVASLGGPAHG